MGYFQQYHGHHNCIEYPRYLHTTHQQDLTSYTMRYISPSLMLTVVVTLLHFLSPVSSITCYACTKTQVTSSSGDCQESHRTQFCKEKEWCFKQWRGQEDNMTGISWGCWDVDPTPE